MVPCYFAGCDGFLFAHSEKPGGLPYLTCTKTDHSALKFGRVLGDLIEQARDGDQSAVERIDGIMKGLRDKMSPEEVEKAWERGLKIRRELVEEG